jgi:hypothetical protein
MSKRLLAVLTFVFSAAPFVTILIFTAGVVFKPGYVYHTDVTESINVDRLYQRYIYTYSNDVGEALAEKARIPLFFAIYGVFRVAKLLGADDSFYVKLKLVALLGVSYVFFVTYMYKLLKLLAAKTQESAAFEPLYVVAANMAGLCYVTNFWFVNRIAHFGLFFTTAILPAVFYYLYKFLYADTSPRGLVKLLVLSALFSATPHTVLMTGLIGGVLFAVYLLSPKNTSPHKLRKTLWLVGYLLASVVVSAYWLLPYLSSLSVPDATLSETIANLFAKYAGPLNGLNLTGYWLTEPKWYYNPAYQIASQILSYVPAVLVLVLGVVYRKRLSLVISVVASATLAVILSTATPISTSLYYYLMFHSPLKSVGWLFREYDKFGIVTACMFALAIGLVIGKLGKKPYGLAPVLLAVALYLYVNFYYLSTTVVAKYTPVHVPKEFAQTVNLLSADTEDFNTAWYPGVTQPYWAKNKEVHFVFANLISPKPTITTRSAFINYLTYLFNVENIYSVNFGKTLDALGIKYLVIRRDDQLFGKNTYATELEIQDTLENVLTAGDITVFKNKSFTGLTKYVTNKLSTNLGLDTLKYLDETGTDPKTTLLDYTDKPSGIAINPTVYLVANNQLLDAAIQQYRERFIFPFQYSYKKEDGNPGYWKIGSLENLNHAETDFFFNNLGLTLPQFDYAQGVVIARDGWQLKPTLAAKDVKQLELKFSRHPNLILTGKHLAYTAVQDDFKYYWDIIRSDKVSTESTTGLLINIKPNIDTDLIPHFKLYCYDKAGNLIDIETVYPNEQNLVNTVVKIPPETAQVDFSIWTLSHPALSRDAGYAYTIDDLTLSDISGGVEPVTLDFAIKQPCSAECWVYARVLKSRLGGTLELAISGFAYSIDTNTHATDATPVPDRYEWVELGKIAELSPTSTRFKLTNLQGFNSVNAIALITTAEREELLRTVSAIPTEKSFTTAPEQQATITTKMIEPTLYEVSVVSPVNQPGVLVFAKPHSTNWRLNISQDPPVVANGYVNGWYLTSLKAGTYYIEYKPQRLFYIGSVVSAVALIISLVYLVATRDVRDSGLSSKSQG